MKYKIENSKRTIGFLIGILLVIGGVVFGIMAIVKHKNGGDDRENQPTVYEALVAVTDQKSSDPVEDARANLKAGDVISYFPEGHPWSETERISYLIIKLKLKPEDAEKLTQPQTKEIEQEEKSDQQQDERLKDMKPRQVTLQARAYRVKIENLNFDVQKFWENHEQPDRNKIYDKGMIEKKKEIK